MFLLGCAAILPHRARAQAWSAWHYHVDITVQPQADDSVDAVYADFTHLLKSTFHASGTLDENSIRVAALQNGQPQATVAFRFIKAKDYDAAGNAAGTLLFAVQGSTNTAASYRIYFDTIPNGPKAAVHDTTAIPITANMVWNGDFEILATGSKLPRGWWGNLKNAGITENKATTAHSGKHAMGIVAPAQKHVSLMAAPTPPGLRVQPRQNYLFAFWIKGKNLSGAYPTHASVYWKDADGKLIQRVNLKTGVSKTATYDWTPVTAYLTAPDHAAYAGLYIGTYSETGLLTIDDIEVRIAVPPLLQVHQ